MRHAKLFGIAVLATMVSVGCGQAPTMNADVSGYGGYKYAKKSYGSDVTQANVISDLHIGHKITQDQNNSQVQVSDQDNTSEQNAANVNALALGGPQSITQASTQSNSSAQAQAADQDQDAVVVGNIEDITIVQSNNIGKRSYSRKKNDRNMRYDD